TRCRSRSRRTCGIGPCRSRRRERTRERWAPRGAVAVSWPAALDPAGVQSARIAALWWWFFGVAVVVWTLVTVMTLVPALQRRRRASLPLMPGGEPFLGSPSGSQPGEPLVIAPLVPHDAARERRLLVVVTSLGVLTTLILVGLLIASVGT